MQWEVIDFALQFLEESGDRICLQVPYASDVRTVTDYIMEKHHDTLIWIVLKGDKILTGRGTIVFEVISTGLSGQETCPSFAVARSNGDLGLSLVDAME